jgi:hypothetical protein
VQLGQYGSFRVAEIKSGTIRSAEGELPGAFAPGFVRYYADCYGENNAFATLDYADNTGGYSVFIGYVFAEPQMQVTQIGPRTAHKVKTEQIKCPSCGGDIPKLSGDRAERVGCPYCGAVSDIAAQQVISQQERALKSPDIPIGSKGTIEGVEYITIAYMRRGSDFGGDHFSWEEYLLWAQPVGFRWLVNDPESGWTWVVPTNIADIDLRGMPDQVGWGGRVFTLRNQNTARVEYVLGEVYWKCEVGETSRIMDFVNGRDVLSREEGKGEVRWSYTTPVPWAVLAQAFGLPAEAPGGAGAGAAPVAARSGCTSIAFILIVLAIILMICMLGACGTCGGGSSGSRGGGVFIGGK